MNTRDIRNALMQLMHVLAEDDGDTELSTKVYITVSRGKKLTTATVYDGDETPTGFVATAKAARARNKADDNAKGDVKSK